MFNPDEIAQLLSDQVSEFLTHSGGRKLPHIEQEFDDEGTTDLLGLDRWQDLRFISEPGFGPIWRDRWTANQGRRARFGGE